MKRSEKKGETTEGLENGGKVEDGSELGEMVADKKGNTFLPGTAPVVIKAIVDQVIEIENNLKPKFVSAANALIGAKENLARLAHENIQHFSPADKDGKRVYRAGGVIVEITFEKEKISAKVEKDEV